VGGDGTMSDVAYALFTTCSTTPILGIGAGSMNAGPLISLKAAELGTLDPDALTVKEAGGILATLKGEHMGLGFNDIVFGDTVLATLDGRVVQVSAAEFMKGRKIPAPPSRAGTLDSEVYIERSGKAIQIHKGEFGQIFAAPLEERYLGKGLAGGTSLAAALGLPAGIAITSEPLINYSIGPDELLSMEPIITRTASFRKGDEVVVRGLKDGTCLNIDGNPIKLLEHDDDVFLSYIPGAAKIMKRLIRKNCIN
jgi:predicted polyphosphate/ATP-dependent NAD kinase